MQRSRVPKVLCIILAIVFAASPAAAGKWKTNAELALRISYDDNVYLQDVEPSPLVLNAAKPSQESLINSVAAKVGLEFTPRAGFNISASYSPEFVVFHDAPEEDHVTHRAGIRLHGVVGKVTWQFQNSFTWIDGSEEGLTFGGPGGAPAIGGISIRDRREAFIYRNSFGAFHKHGRWFFRPAVSSYIHDFRTSERDPVLFPHYQNYVDRNDFNVGLDAGFRVFPEGYLFLAYRFGSQHEPSLPQQSFDYSNNYRRLLLGFEGRPANWLKLNLFAGPDWRHFNHRPPAGFDRTPRRVYIDATAEFVLTSADSVTATVRRFEQPAFGAPSAYEDITYECSWRHIHGKRVSSSVGVRVYGGVWEPPVAREDWIATPSASFTYTHDSHLRVEMSWSMDRARSSIPNKAGRDFTRQLLSVGARYAF